MDVAGIEDIQVNPNRRITVDMRKRLIDIAQRLLGDKKSVLSTAVQEQKDKALEKYCKGVGFDKLVAEITKKAAELKIAKNKLVVTGLTEQGLLDNTYYGQNSDEEAKHDQGVKKVTRILDAIDKANQLANNYDDKIISLLTVVESVGEAWTIMRELLGNGIISGVEKKALALTENTGK